MFEAILRDASRKCAAPQDDGGVCGVLGLLGFTLPRPMATISASPLPAGTTSPTFFPKQRARQRRGVRTNVFPARGSASSSTDNAKGLFAAVIADDRHRTAKTHLRGVIGNPVRREPSRAGRSK